jgi:radical SAM enzyme (TIGR01210 family)
LIHDVHYDIHPSNSGNGSDDQVSRLIIHPTAGGKVRGSHNCGKCDGDVVAAIERYSVSGDIRDLDGLDCTCKAVWRREIDLDNSMPIPLGSGKNRRGNALSHLRSP